MEDDSDKEYEDVGMPDEFSESEDEKDDCLIRKTDSLIIAATAENDHSSLEVYIYDHKTSDLYVHHEILLGSYPLCLQWLHSWQGIKSNHIIVGNFLPEIEIWNLDSENVEPTAVLGSLQNSEKAKNGLIKSYSKKKN
jgi:periodic tryptophan protein 1